MDWMTWYDGLEKPSWTPSPSTIGLIWQILYPIIIVTFRLCFRAGVSGQGQLDGRLALRHQPRGEPDLHAH